LWYSISTCNMGCKRLTGMRIQANLKWHSKSARLNSNIICQTTFFVWFYVKSMGCISWRHHKKKQENICKCSLIEIIIRQKWTLTPSKYVTLP
jgi:hypothetical protein